MEVRIGQMDATIRATPSPEPAEAAAHARRTPGAETVPSAPRCPGLEADRRLRVRLTPDESRHEVAK
jgi:hypothetical protein